MKKYAVETYRTVRGDASAANTMHFDTVEDAQDAFDAADLRRAWNLERESSAVLDSVRERVDIADLQAVEIDEDGFEEFELMDRRVYGYADYRAEQQG
ncbi:hypothetical protein [Gordonibacter sp.]|uniref:hypothetical protein n=1 Tax=Gordonibacter sp. TaxID=1968902 RepID=UPI002FC7869B